MPRSDVVVVGGGIGGLTCAAFLANQDIEVTLVERSDRPGGLARGVKVGDHIIPANLGRSEGFDEADPKRRILEHLGILDRVPVRPAPALCDAIVDDGFRMTLPAGAGAFREALLSTFPEDARGIRRVLDSIERLPGEFERLGDTSRAAIVRFLGFPIFYPALFRLRGRFLGPWLRSRVRSPRARLALAATAPLVGTSAEDVAATAYGVALAPALRSPVAIQGGGRALANALAEAARRRGASVRLSAPAEAIVVEGRAARGVRTASDEIRAKVVVSNAPPHVTFGRLLPREALYASFLQRLGVMRPSASACVLLLAPRCGRAALGIASDLALVHAGDDLEAHARAVDEETVAGRTIAAAVHDAPNAPDGTDRCLVTAVVPDRAARWSALDDAARDALAAETEATILERLRAALPGLRSGIDVGRLLTPIELASWSGDPEGCAFGFEQTPSQSGAERLASRTPVDNVLLAGAWTYPGAGYTGTMMSGFLAALQAAMALGVRIRM